MPTLSQWRDTWRQLGFAAADEGLFREVMGRYGEPHRRYHTPQHLAECFENFRQLEASARRPGEIGLALWFHDAIYDVASRDNEARSAEWAAGSLLSLGRAQGTAAEVLEAVAARVRTLIMATRHDAVPEGTDAQILVDVDLWILGAPAERFDEYERQVREEYRHIPGPVFRHKRAAILTGFLERPRLFGTPLFLERYEPQARANLARSLRRLGGD